MKKEFLIIAQTVVISISLLISFCSFSYAKPIAGALDIAGNEILIIWFVIIMFIDAVVAIPFARLRLQKKAFAFCRRQNYKCGALIGLNVYFLKVAYNPSVGIGYVVLANLIANAFYLLFFFRILLVLASSFRQRQYLRRCCSYAYPIMITGLAGMTKRYVFKANVGLVASTRFLSRSKS